MRHCSIWIPAVVIAFGVIVFAGLVFVLWVLPITLGIKQAQKKNYSPAWMWFGVHPLFGWKCSPS